MFPTIPTKTLNVTTRTSRRPRTRPPALRFTPYAWAKLLCLRDRGPTEVGGFGVTAAADPLLVEDLRLVRQSSSAVTVAFDDEAVADRFDELVDAGLPPERFARVWIHTHPGECPRPSGTDERTFARVFGGCDWAVMAILAAGGAAYARLAFAAGPGGDLELPVAVDFGVPCGAADPAAWAAEHHRCVTDESARLALPDRVRPRGRGRVAAGDGFDGPFSVPEPEPWESSDEHERREFHDGPRTGELVPC